MTPIVDGEDLEQAEEVKHKNLTGPSEAELSKAQESKHAYVPPYEADKAPKETKKK